MKSSKNHRQVFDWTGWIRSLNLIEQEHDRSCTIIDTVILLGHETVSSVFQSQSLITVQGTSMSYHTMSSTVKQVLHYRRRNEGYKKNERDERKKSYRMYTYYKNITDDGCWRRDTYSTSHETGVY